MIKTKISTKEIIQPAEKFFIEKSLELLSNSTLDTYRLRINNPKTILFELISVIGSIKKGTLKESYAQTLCLETIDLYNKENELIFKSITKSFFLNSLSKKNYDTIYFACNLIIYDNKDYTNKLFNFITTEITRINSIQSYDYKTFSLLNKYIQYFFIDLKNYGYSKQYLYNFILAVFGNSNPINTFADGMRIISTLICRKIEKFKIFFAFKNTGIAKDLLLIDSFELIHITRHDISLEAKSINIRFENFISENVNYQFYYIEQNAIDYYSAGSLARRKLQNVLDILYNATDDDIFNLHPMCFVHGTLIPSKGKLQNLSYKLDGHYSPNINTYKTFIQKYKKILPKFVDNVTIKKVYSTLRYLRLGTLASEQEHKILNYWIAIEYLYSATSVNEKKTERLNDYFKKIHSNYYVRRLFWDLHNSIKTFKIQKCITKFSEDDLNYLFEESTLNQIESYKLRYPLLYYRYHSTINRFSNSNQILTDLKRHSDNIVWNLTRIYRTRNEIVHSAATDIEVIELASHLKYYLVFTFNALISFLLSSPIDTNNDQLLSIEDFFLVESIKYDSLIVNKNISVTDLVKVSNPIEYLQG